MPCPRCGTGHLRLEPKTLIVVAPEYNSTSKDYLDWEPDWHVDRFSAHLKCDEPKCGERVVMSGDTELTEIADEDGGQVFESMLRPRSLFPAVMLIDIPASTSSEVHTELYRAFGLFWDDVDAAANRVRVAIERLMDQLKVAKKITSKKGKMVNLDLNGRIDRFSHKNPEFKDAMHGLRMMGNLGSHGSGVSRGVFLDGLEMLEHALSDLVGDKKKKMKSIAKHLVASKGKKSK